jgi:hypothetical protein
MPPRDKADRIFLALGVFLSLLVALAVYAVLAATVFRGS